MEDEAGGSCHPDPDQPGGGEDIDSRRFLVSSGLASPLSLLRDYLQTNSSVMPRELVDQGEAEYESNVI